MNRLNNAYAVALLTAGVFFLNSCKKEIPVKTKADQTAITKDIVLTQVRNTETALEMQSIAIGIVQYGSSHFKTSGGFLQGFSCATVTKDTVSNPHTATVDFGSGCTNADGKFMSGSITVEYTDPNFHNPGTHYNVTFTNFVDDARNVSGTILLTNTSSQLNGTTASLETNLTTNYSKENLQVTGRNHFDLAFAADSVSDHDAITHFTGSGNGTTAGGVDFTQTITSELLLPLICTHFTAGTLFIQSPGQPDQTIDYGDGTCDNQATVTDSNGSTYTITLQ